MDIAVLTSLTVTRLLFLGFLTFLSVWIAIYTLFKGFGIFSGLQKKLKILPKWLYLTPTVVQFISTMGVVYLAIIGSQKTVGPTTRPILNCFIYILSAIYVYGLFKIMEMKSKKSTTVKVKW